MDNHLTYTFVQNKIKSEYEYQFKAFRELLSKPVEEIDVQDVEQRLGHLAALKMKLDILNAAGNNLNVGQQLLFD